MKVNDINKIEELKYFSDDEIFEAIEFVCFKDKLEPNFLTYKIKIGKLVFTVNGNSIDDFKTNQKVGNKIVEVVL